MGTEASNSGLCSQSQMSDKRTPEYATSMMFGMEIEDDFLHRVLFSDEATFHLSGCVNRHNCRIWGQQIPEECYQHERDSPKVNVWCGLMFDRIVGPFFFAEKAITGDIYADMLVHYLFPQLDVIERTSGVQIIYQLDGSPVHYSIIVRQALERRFPNRWIGRRGWIHWPAHSPDLTLWTFSSGGT